MSADTDINTSLRDSPLGEDSPLDDTNTDHDVKITNSGAKDEPEIKEPSLSPKEHSNKKRQKRRKGNKENVEAKNYGSKFEESESTQMKVDPKDDKTKANMQRQKQLSENQVLESNDNDSKMEKRDQDDGVTDEASEDELTDLANPDEMDGNARNKVYQRGLEYVKKGKKNSALKCFMACLSGLADKEGFSFFPQCIKQMADIYYSREEYEKAIQFIQAEKMYYETALINTTGLQKKLEEDLKEKNATKDDEGSASVEADPEVLRAEEYENLSRLCLERKQAELALEYQGKATKLRQQLYGAEHPLTKKSLDFFTAVYAEVGKQQYTESLQKFSEKPAECSLESPPEGPTEPHLRRRPLGILRSSSEESKRKDLHVRFEEPETRERDNGNQEQEEWISRGILWVLFSVCLLVLGCLLAYVYCRLEPGSALCTTWRTQSNYYYMRFKYLYYTWNANTKNKFG